MTQSSSLTTSMIVSLKKIFEIPKVKVLVCYIQRESKHHLTSILTSILTSMMVSLKNISEIPKVKVLVWDTIGRTTHDTPHLVFVTYISY
jgi:hypothetical protein